jgi:hypothetical protein
MPADKGRTFVTQSISFHPSMLARAKERADRLGLPFSTYVQKCLERDLTARDPIVFEERSEAASPEPAEPKPRARAAAAKRRQG